MSWPSASEAFRFWPEQKPRPSPVSTSARIKGSAVISATAFASAPSKSGVIALRLSGSFSVRMPTAPSLSCFTPAISSLLFHFRQLWHSLRATANALMRAGFDFTRRRISVCQNKHGAGAIGRSFALALSKGDDFPIHQTPEPVAYAGTDRNFYDRYFFNGYSTRAGNTSFFAVAFGVYPHLNIADAAFVVVRNGVETALHASRCLRMERMDISAGPIRIEVIEPLHKLRVAVNDPERGIAADLVFTGRALPIEEPRFIRRIGPRTVMDYTRLTQNGRYHGFVELDGVRE